MKNKRLRRQDTNKGITLIALVITIIVMLILVAVTITMAVNGGLFEYAQNAGALTNGAVANEQILASGQVTIEGTTYNSIDEFIAGEKVVEATREDFFVIDEETGIVSVREDTSENHDGVGYYYDAVQQGYVLSEENVVIPEKVNGKEVKGLADNMFQYATNLKSVVISEGVETIGRYAFENCSSLNNVIMPNSLCSIGWGTFFLCANLTEISIPDGVTSIEDQAFSYCSALATITVPDSVTKIGNGAFYETKWYNEQSNGEVYIGRVLYKYKGDMAEGTSVSIKDGTKGIADYAFANLTGLTNITIPNSVVSIGKYAFDDCTGLTEISIPVGITEIGDCAFYNCKNLQSIVYLGTTEQWNEVSLGSSWRINVKATKVQCSDGTVNI